MGPKIKRSPVNKVKDMSSISNSNVSNKQDPFEAAIENMESLDEGCEKPNMLYSFDTCATEGCTHSDQPVINLNKIGKKTRKKSAKKRR